MRYLLAFFLSAIFSSAVAQKLVGKVFVIGRSDADCKIVSDCDCCMSELMLLNATQFALIDNCTYSHTLTAGTYKVEAGKLKLTFVQAAVTKGQEDFMQAPENPYMRKDKGEIKPMSFTISNCDNEQVLECPEYPDYGFGIQSKTGGGENLTNFMKSDTWKLLTGNLPDEFVSVTLYKERVFVEGEEFQLGSEKTKFEKAFKELIENRTKEGLAINSIYFDLRIHEELTRKEIADFETYIRKLGASAILYSSFK